MTSAPMTTHDLHDTKAPALSTAYGWMYLLQVHLVNTVTACQTKTFFIKS